MIIYFLILIFGLIVGSFLNCVIFRIKEGKGFLFGSSYCPYCKHPLMWHDLIPVLSFIILRRRCRYCQKLISYQYPLVEISTGLMFLLIFNFQFPIFNSQFSWTLLGGLPGGLLLDFQLFNFIYYLVILCFLIVIFVYDLKHLIIPDKVLYPAIAISIIYRLIHGLFQAPNFQIFNFLFATIIISGFFFFIYLFSKGKWIGFGDVKLGILLGMLLGWPKILLGLFLSFIIGGIMGIVLVLSSKKKLKSEVPFAPFLIIGTLIALIWGEQILAWYFSLMF